MVGQRLIIHGRNDMDVVCPTKYMYICIYIYMICLYFISVCYKHLFYRDSCVIYFLIPFRLNFTGRGQLWLTQCQRNKPVCMCPVASSQLSITHLRFNSKNKLLWKIRLWPGHVPFPCFSRITSAQIVSTTLIMPFKLGFWSKAL